MNPNEAPLDQTTKAKLGAPDSGRYFRYMAEFVGLTSDDEQAIVQSKPIIVKHLPEIVGDFYDHLLRYPPTRKFFLKKDGTVDEAYLQLRMQHNANFWLRVVEGNYDDTFASYLDYVGRAHTTHGADSSIYIPERYVIGQVGFVSYAISKSISAEAGGTDEALETRAIEAWSKLMMVVLELLSRAYNTEREADPLDPLIPVDDAYVERLATTVTQELTPEVPTSIKRITVARADDIPDGDRKIVTVDGLSIGIFHHNGSWSALHNRCLHRGGPVCTGKLDGDVLTCPWHGFQYDVTSGQLIIDPKSHLDTFVVHIENGDIRLEIPQFT